MFKSIATVIAIIAGLIAIGTSVYKVVELKGENAALKVKLKDYEKLRDDYSRLVIEIIVDGKITLASVAQQLNINEVNTIKSQLPKCKELLFSSSPIRIHFFNGTKIMAERAAHQTNIPITLNPRNVIGTEENTSAYSIDLSGQTLPNEGIIKINGTYEIHADDFGGGIPSAYITTIGSNGNITRIPIKISHILKVPTDFSVDIDYRSNEIKRIELHVQSAGSWGFFIHSINASACNKD